MTAPVFFAEVADVRVGTYLDLGGDEGRHASDVRRLRVGEDIDLTDGAGVILHGVVHEVRKGGLTVEVIDRFELPPPTPRVTVVQALARGGRDELAVESMTEVGVDRIVGWEASRNVAHWTPRTLDKWTATARSATKQSRRGWCPAISGPSTTREAADLCARADIAIVLHEGAQEGLSAVDLSGADDIVVVVGPEGGIAPDELAIFHAADARVLRLGDSVLRSSTAGVAALAVIFGATRWS